MLFNRRQKFCLIAFSLIVPLIILSGLISGARATWTYGCDSASGCTNSDYIVSPGQTPVIDGVLDPSWSFTNVSVEDSKNPRLDFRMIFNGSTVYSIVTVRNDTHSQNETVMLLISNNNTQLIDSTYFIDAKYLDINNVTYDLRQVAQSYFSPSSKQIVQNITGACSFDNSSSHNWTRYEYGFPYNSTNPDIYMNWTIGGEYLLKIRYYPDLTNPSVYTEYDPINIQFGGPGTTSNTNSTLNLNMDVVTQVIFYSVVGIYGAIGIYVIISKQRVNAPAARSTKKVERAGGAEEEEEEVDEEVDEDFSEGTE